MPLLPVERVHEIAVRLNPVFSIDDNDVVMATQFIAVVPAAMLGKRIGSLSDEHDAIIAALDMLFQGF